MLKSFKVASVAGSHHRNVPARRAIACAIAAAFATTLSASAIAQDAPPSDDSAKLLDSVVVNAQFKQQNLQDTPLAITAITANRLDDMSIDNVAELGQIAPNVQMAQGGGIVGKTTAVYIRGVGGFDFSPAFEPGVGFYVDDVYHATVFGSSFDLLDIDRVEILRGPQGTLFGKNSIGGAVRIVSAAPNGDGTGRIEATIGAYDRRDLRASFDFGLTDNLAIRASALSRQREGHVDQIDFACANPTLAAGVPRVTSPGQDCKVGTLGGENASGARLQARWTPSDRFTLNFSVDRVTDNSEAAGSVLYYMDDSNAQMGLFNSLLGVPQYGRGYNSDFMPRNPYSSYASFKNDLLDFDLGSFNRLTAEGVAATMEWRLSDAFTLKSITAKRVTDGGFSFDFDGSPMAYNSQSNHLYAKQFSQEIQLLGTLMDGRLDVATGLFYLDLDTELTGIVNLGRLAQLGRAGLSFDQRNQSAVDNWAIFGHAMYKATDKLTVSAGVRYTDETKSFILNQYYFPSVPEPTRLPLGTGEEVSYGKWSPRVAVDYAWSDTFMTYASVSTGYRGGGVNPRPSTPTQAVAFYPEDITSYEAGFKGEYFDRTLRINAAAFLSKYTDLQLNVIDPIGSVPRNVGSVDITGIEAEISYRPSANFAVDFSMGYNNFDIQDLGALPIQAGGPTLDSKQQWVPDMNYALGMHYDLAVGERGLLTPRVDVMYQDETYHNLDNNPLSRLPARTLVNARLTYETLEGDWRASIGITNLTDKLYYHSLIDQVAGTGVMVADIARPREWSFTLSRRF